MCAIAESKDDAYETATGFDGGTDCDVRWNDVVRHGERGGADPPGSITRCEPFEVERYRFHQHCIVTMPDVDGEIFLSEYWIDEYGNPYLM
ncbi:hypothetical protein [Stenotrophomonas geniculata]|uniref:hypothetical protein n=1 Tax=Stenotrophomonas geniculata TaxID=86188 RepID=UPI001E523EFA|nr:hypothetical protein [Stenotrophomonas geniculata]